MFILNKIDFLPTRKYDNHFTVVSTSPTTVGFELTHNLYDSKSSGSLATKFDIARIGNVLNVDQTNCSHWNLLFNFDRNDNKDYYSNKASNVFAKLFFFL